MNSDGCLGPKFTGITQETILNRLTQSIFASLVLTALTMGVFSAAQSVGPESVVRRWIRAVQSGDASSASVLINQPLQSQYSGWLIDAAATLPAGSSTRLVSKQRSGSLVILTTEHRVNPTMAAARYWVLQREGGKWRIDPQRTYQFVDQAVRMP